MSTRPEVNPGDWILVEYWNCAVCVVCNVNPEGHELGDAEVISRPSKPARFPVRWNGTAWTRLHADGLASYAKQSPRLREYIAKT